MAQAPEDPVPVGRRALLAGGLGAAALLAAPAEACFLMPTGPMPKYMLTDRQARIYLGALLTQANKGDKAVLKDLQDLPRFEIHNGETTVSYWEAPRMLVSHGRRDSAPASVEAMTRLATGGSVRLYLAQLRRTLYFPPPPSRENGCNRSPEEGFHERSQAWLYRYHPDRPALIRTPALDDDLYALFPDPPNRRA